MAQVTIGLPIYNGADHLDGALASLCAQNFDDLCILISDNASTDATPDIVAKWAANDKRIVSYRQKENIGSVGNFNWLIENAESPWFMYGAHDDYWSDNYVKALHAVLMTHPDAELAVGTMVTLFENGKEHNRFPYPVKANDAPNLAKQRLLLRYAASGWFHGLYDREKLIEVRHDIKGFDYTWSRDFILMLSFLLSGKTVGATEAVYYKRETPVSENLYRPKTLREQCMLYIAFVKQALAILKVAPLSKGQRFRLLPALMSYAGCRTRTRLLRLVRMSVTAPFQRVES
ncbi:MAG: glycosyltransferase family A protein [Pseudomonadota bacterium]|nr:glycosyltransferase family A protein [Pseudomonadota bacterium]